MKPYVLINFASSLDGRLAVGTGEQTRLSCEEDMKRVNRIRNSVDGIMVGIGTIISDDPSLTVKKKYIENEEVRNPVRIVLDSHLRIPENARVLDGTVKTIIYTTTVPDKKLNAEIRICGEGIVDLECVLEDLYRIGIKRLMVEGGSRVIGSFIEKKFYDEINIYMAPVIIGHEAPPMATLKTAMNENEIYRLKMINIEKLCDGILIKIKNDQNNNE